MWDKSFSHSVMAEQQQSMPTIRQWDAMRLVLDEYNRFPKEAAEDAYAHRLYEKEMARQKMVKAEEELWSLHNRMTEDLNILMQYGNAAHLLQLSICAFFW